MQHVKERHNDSWSHLKPLLATALSLLLIVDETTCGRIEREFGEDAARCDIHRKIRRHVALSYGPHHCVGAAAVRLQARVALEELTSRCPDFTVDAAKGEFAGGNYVRRYLSMPLHPDGNR